MAKKKDKKDDAVAGDDEKITESVGDAVPVKIIKQYVKDISFENPNTPASVLARIEEPDTEFKLNVQGRVLNEEGLAESMLMVRAEVRDKQHGKTIFIIEMAYGCVLSLADVDEKFHKRILMVEAPRMMFPFVREIIARHTTDGGYQALYINSIRFEELFDAKEGSAFEGAREAEFTAEEEPEPVAAEEK